MSDVDPVPERMGRAATGLQRLERVSWRSVLQVVLLVLAVSVLVNKIAGLDLDEVADELRDASWSLVGLAFVVAQAPRLTQTLSTLGAAPRPLPARPVYLLQLAQGYVGLAVPTSAARVAMNIRFFQKQGFSSGAALAIGGLDGFAGFLVEAGLLAGLIALTPQTLHFDVDAPSLPQWRTILAILIALAAVVAVVSILLPGRRREMVAWAKDLLADGRGALRELGSPRRLLLLLGGNLASIVLFSSALGLFAAALGTTVSFSDLVVIVVSVSLLAGLLPVPGGIGVVETGLTLGLVAAGMPEGPAFAAVILYRMSTFYVPPLWGYAAFRWLEGNRFL
ncbi:MAG: flippase-like domain-containing protein [Acidimicrobiales bacterium]|nr:flippase-like domain-containing protein [Acidimicrobiales bacterium]